MCSIASYLCKQIDNATGIVDISLLNVLTIEPTSLTTEQKILASQNLKSCIESNYTLPTPPDFMLASRNMTKGWITVVPVLPVIC